MIQLISTDFDGTLISHGFQPPVVPELFDVLREFRAQGGHWAVNTGRTLWHAEDGLRREFRFPIEPDFLLVEERDIYRRSRSGNWEPVGDWNARCASDHAQLFDLAKPLLAEVLRFIELLEGTSAIHEGGRFIGAMTRDEAQMDRLCAFLEKLRERIPLFNFQRNTIYVRFCHVDYSKGTALAELSRHLGITREVVFAAGDHHNDLPMLDGRFAKWVTCPGNSVEEVKLTVRTAGGYVAKGVASIGVVEALRHFAAVPSLVA
jgi:hydroxymethylpyrimidine pyrophosphatase-like HAD family hydrolase